MAGAEKTASGTHLGANPKLSEWQLARLYANPNSCGYLCLTGPVFLLGLLKGAAGGVLGAIFAVCVWTGLALAGVIPNVAALGGAIWGSRTLGPVLKALALPVLPLLTLLAWPFYAVFLALYTGASRGSSTVFEATCNSLQPLGQNWATFTVNPFSAGVTQSCQEVRHLVAEFSKYVQKPFDSLCTALKGTEEAKQQTAAARDEPNYELRLLRIPGALLIGLLGGFTWCLGVLALGIINTVRITRHLWHQLASWASGRSATPGPSRSPSPPGPAHLICPQCNAPRTAPGKGAVVFDRLSPLPGVGLDRFSPLPSKAAMGMPPMLLSPRNSMSSVASWTAGTTPCPSLPDPSAQDTLPDASLVAPVVASPPEARQRMRAVSADGQGVGVDHAAAAAASCSPAFLSALSAPHAPESPRSASSDSSDGEGRRKLHVCADMPAEPAASTATCQPSSNGAPANAASQLQSGQKAAEDHVALKLPEAVAASLGQPSVQTVAAAQLPHVAASAKYAPSKEQLAHHQPGQSSEDIEDDRWECCVKGCGPFTWMFAVPAMLFCPFIVLGAVFGAAMLWLGVGAAQSCAAAYSTNTNETGMLAAGLKQVVDGLESLHLTIKARCGDSPQVRDCRNVQRGRRSEPCEVCGYDAHMAGIHGGDRYHPTLSAVCEEV